MSTTTMTNMREDRATLFAKLQDPSTHGVATMDSGDLGRRASA